MIKKLFIAILCAMPFCLMAQEFGYVNTAEIFQAMPATQEANKKLEQLQKSYEDELLAYREELDRKGKEYIAERDSMLASIRMSREAELQNLQQRIEGFYQDAMADINKQQQEMLVPIHKALMDAISQVGEELGMIYIMDISSEGSLMYYSKSKCKDVTNAVRAKLGIK